MRDIGKEAEEVILALKKQNNDRISLKISQIRKFLIAVNEITNKINIYKAKHLDVTTLPDELIGEVQFLKVKAAYQAGRNRDVKNFIEKSHMKEEIQHVGDSIAKYEEFARYIEALVAYHKFYGGKD